MRPKVINDPVYNYLRLDPIPTQEEVDTFYAQEFYASNANYFNNSALALQQEQSDFFNSRWENIYQISNDFFKGGISNKKVFDIGFGFAQALIYLKNKGLNVAGLEPSPEGVAYALENGIEAYHSGIENFNCVNGEKYEIVLLMNVLEHLREPANTVLNIRKELLSKDGLLVIDVPNDFNDFQTIATKEYNLDEWWVVSPNHINYFSPESLQNLLTQCGYKIVHCETSFPLDMFLLFGDVYVGNSELGRSCHNKRVNFEQLMRKHGKGDKLREFYTSLAKLNLGRSISIYATPI
ncbi:MAG: hypothetical protein RLZZ546_1528 [Bacteroidota bacterium]|jgi:2-polyprenyl-3-methyl-5-hydroxy-6-metoxy-1,4-benzoquinol methylase